MAALAGDASSRRYFRAALSGTRAPSSVVIMALPAESSLPLSSEELAIFKEPLNELPFLNLHRFLTGIGARVPKLFGHWENQGILILEDLGDTALWNQVQGLPEEEVLAWYRRAIDELLLLQIAGTHARDENCIAFQQRFDYRLYMWEFEHFLEYGLEKRPGAAVSSHALALLREVFAGLARRLDSETPWFNHRDYHSWNLMVHDDAVAVIDFQDALLAPAQYDLASLLNDRITDTVITARLEECLLQYYMEQRAARTGTALSADAFREIYLLSAIQRDLKVVGRFCYLDVAKGKPGYKKFIPGTLRRLKRNLARVAETEKIIPILAAALPGDAMKAMVFAAGEGRRLRPITEKTPKPLVPVAGRPMIDYPLLLLRHYAINEIIINLHHLGDQVEDYLGDGAKFGLRICYSKESELLDTGGGLLKAKAFLQDATFIVINTDVLIDLPLAEVLGVSPPQPKRLQPWCSVPTRTPIVTAR